jgi:hypothetical protein
VRERRGARGVAGDGNLPLLFSRPRWFSGELVEAWQGKGEGGLARACLQMSGEVGEGKMASRGTMGSVQGVLYPGGGRGARGFDLHRLGGGAVRSERRSEMSSRVWSLWSGVQRCRQGQVIFRAPARLFELTPVASVGFGSDGVVQGGGGTMPCRIERCAARFHPSSAGNTGARSGRSRLAGDRARAWQLGGARSRLVGGRHWVVEWRGQRGYW